MNDLSKMSKEEFHAYCDETIRNAGWMALTVNSSVPYTYSVGFTEIDLPEIIVYAKVPTRIQGTMVDNLCRKMHEINNIPGNLNEVVDFQIGENIARFVLREVTANALVLENYALQTKHRYGLTARYLQLVLADKNNLLPGEEGYDVEFIQPLL